MATENASQVNCQIDPDKKSEDTEKQSPAPVSRDISSPVVKKESNTGTKPKRKARSTRRRLNAMVSNTSLHFSDTDSEGELTMISQRNLSPVKLAESPQGPEISVTVDPVEDNAELNEYPNCLAPDDKGVQRRGSYTENLTDVDEIYPSDQENEAKENCNNLAVAENSAHGDTDLEDLEAEDEVQSTIFVKPRSDILTEFSGETIMTMEGDGPFSVEVRNKMSTEQHSIDDPNNDTPEVVIEPNTDEEDMVASDEEELQGACYIQNEVVEDLDSCLAASQIAMTNVSKGENLSVKEIVDDASDCHTDVEDVE